MSKIKLILAVSLAVVLIAIPLFGACAKPAAPPPPPAPTPTPAPPPTPTPPPPEKPPIKIGALIAYTGPAVTTSKPHEYSFEYVLDKAGWEVAGRKIILVKEDAAGDPVVSVEKARKLVEADKVDVIFGPMLGSGMDAVAAFLEPSGIPHIHTSHVLQEVLKYEHVFMTGGTNETVAYPWGVYAYDKLGLKRVILMPQDYSSAKAYLSGFAEGFTSRGGTVVQEVAIPFGTFDFGAYLTKLDKSADCVAFFLVAGTNLAFVTQSHEYGLKMSLLLTPSFPFEETDLAEVKDAGLGMIGFAAYSPEIDTPVNKLFVKEYREKYGVYPGFAAMQAYSAMTLFLEALKATGGDTTPGKLIAAMKGVSEYETPGGTYGMTPERHGVSDTYCLEVAKIGDRYAWKVLERIPITK